VKLPAQLGLFKKRGGRRRGAGRPPKGARAGAPHRRRPVLCARFPVHATLRVAAELGNLRRQSTYLAIQRATLTVARRADFRIVHLSVQRTHLHLLVEADDKTSLARGLQAFQISAAKWLNAAVSEGRPGGRRRGPVFPDRYHATIVTSPRQARHVLAYVLSNWRRHQEDRDPELHGWKIDWFSSAVMFPDWTEYRDEPPLWRGAPIYEPLIVFQPRTWLLREGWKKHATTLSCFEVPAAAR